MGFSERTTMQVGRRVGVISNANKRKSTALPPDNGLGLEDFQGIQHIRRKPIEPGEHKPVDIVNVELMSQR